jgi:hypothetical protein
LRHHNGTLPPTPFLAIPTTTAGERGLLGVAFAENGFDYVYEAATTPTAEAARGTATCVQ